MQRIKRRILITSARIREGKVKQFALSIHDGNIALRVCYNEDEVRDQYCHKYLDTPRLPSP
jgi:hypothetical protein